MPPIAPQTIPFGTILQGKVSTNLSEAARRESVSKQGQMVITRACRPAGRIKVILVGEDLGF